MNNEEIEKEIKVLSTSIINELDNLTPEQMNQLLDALENGIVIKSPSFIKSNYLEMIK